MGRAWRGAARGVVLAAAMLVLAPERPGAQIPEKFKNLRILPQDIPRRELIDQMRRFAGALGVRCVHCHVGRNVETLEGFDFASDEKETKRVARAMMQMVQEINEKLLPAAGREKPRTVACITCHRGSTRPVTLYELLLETSAKDGVDAALKQYRELRDKHLGDGQYDFSPSTLSAFAESLARDRKDLEGALAVGRLNSEFHPAAPHVHTLIGRLCLEKGDRECAVAAFGKAVELAPDDVWIRGQLEAAKATPARPD